MLDEVKNQVGLRRAAERTLEGKANVIAGFAIGLVSSAGLLKSAAGLQVNVPAFKVLAITTLACVVLALLARVPMDYDVPNAALFNLRSTVANESNEARIAMALTEKWRSIEDAQQASNKKRSARITFANWALFASLLVYFLIVFTAQ